MQKVWIALNAMSNYQQFIVSFSFQPRVENIIVVVVVMVVVVFL